MTDNAAAMDTDVVVKATDAARDCIKRGLEQGALVDEKALRFIVLCNLAEGGIEKSRLKAEYSHPKIDRAKVDLVVLGDKPDDEPAPEIAVEFKYHRKPDGHNSDRTGKAAQLITDFARLRQFPNAQRYAVYLTDCEMLEYYRNNRWPMLLPPQKECVISKANFCDKAEGFRDAAKVLHKCVNGSCDNESACDWWHPVQLRMRAHWNVGSDHKLIVWQVWPA